MKAYYSRSILNMLNLPIVQNLDLLFDLQRMSLIELSVTHKEIYQTIGGKLKV